MAEGDKFYICTLKSLRCVETLDDGGRDPSDEIQMDINPDLISYGSFFRQMKKGESWRLNMDVAFKNRIVIELYERGGPLDDDIGEINRPTRFIGKYTITPVVKTNGWEIIQYRYQTDNWVDYQLYYDVKEKIETAPPKSGPRAVRRPAPPRRAKKSLAIKAGKIGKFGRRK